MLTDEQMEQRRAERAAQLAAIDEQRQSAAPVTGDPLLSDVIHAAGGKTGTRGREGDPWRDHGMRYARQQWPRGMNARRGQWRSVRTPYERTSIIGEPFSDESLDVLDRT